MAEDSVIKSVDKSEYDVGKRYRLIDIMRQVVAPTLDSKYGLKMDEILSGEDLEQMLNAYLDGRGVWNLNINSSFYVLNLPDEVLTAYSLPIEMRWPSISYRLYGTTRLAWLLMKLNGVRDQNIFKEVPAGTAVRYLDRTKYVDKILAILGEMKGNLNG